MFNKPAVLNKAPSPALDRQPRTTHTPGAYPSLSNRQHQSEAEQSALLAANVAEETSATRQPERPAGSSKPNTTTENEQSAQTPSDNRLLVGPQVKLKGAEILDCDTLIVEGRVEATMDSRVIQIAEGGAFSGKVGIDIAEIRGNFEGELTARERLVIHATGRVKGKIRYGTLLIESGGVISGEIESLADGSSAANSNPERNLLLKSVMGKAVSA